MSVKANMRRSIAAACFTFLLQLFVTVQPAAALDNPHNTISMNCQTCHIAAPPANWWTDQGQTGGLCGQCHNSGLPMGDVQTHSTSAKYGNITQQCTACHDPHYQMQNRQYRAESYQYSSLISSATASTLTRTGAGWDPERPADGYLGQWAGMLLIPDVRYQNFNYRIISNTADTLTVDTSSGSINLTYAKPGATFAIVYGKLVKRSIASKVVKFFRKAGEKSFADGVPRDPITGRDTVVDGVCQVCHTKTTSFNNAGILESATHPSDQRGTNCKSCHTHTGGFQGGCTTCHGYPPVEDSAGPNGLAFNPGTTGSAFAGAHAAHVTNVNLVCADCHYNSAGSGATHNNGDLTITMGFYNFDGAVQGGQYDGQINAVNPSLPLYNTTTTTPATTVSKTGAMTCSTVYCHSTVQTASGGALTAGDYRTPSWKNEAPNNVQCGSCHKADGTGDGSLMDSGSHTKHVASSGYSMPCANCHTNAGAGAVVHVNNLINVAINTTYGGSYTGSTSSPGNHAPGQGFGTCSTVYCHSDGKATPTTVASVAWGGSPTTCTSCHGGAAGSTGGATTALSANHTVHTGATYNYGCADCHSSVVSDNSTVTNKNLHVDKTRNVAVAAARGGTGGNYDSGTGSCSTTYCHGTASPAWTMTPTANAVCTKCHGNPTAPGSYVLYKAAPGADGVGTNTGGTAGTVTSNVSNDPKVGAHDTHLRALNAYGRAAVCSDCHSVPSLATDTGHIDSALPAELIWSSLVTSGGTLTPQFTAGQCSNTYCHGNAMPKGSTDGLNRTPSWTDGTYLAGTPTLAGDCSKCHASPPLAVSPHTALQTFADCAQCHSHFNADGTLNNAALHIDGALQATGGCDGCHAYPPAIGDNKAYLGSVQEGKGAHTRHVNHLLARTGYTLDPANDTFTSAKVAAICGVCHDTSNSANHMNGNNNREMLIPASYLFAATGSPTYNGSPTTSSTTQFKSCSNVSCHFKASPGWQDPATAGL